MTIQKINIECPACHHAFALDEVYSKQIEANLKKDFDKKTADLVAKQKTLKEQEEALIKSRESLDEEVARRLLTEKNALLQTERVKIKQGFDLELKDLQTERDDMQTKLGLAQKQELEFRKRAREIEDKEKNLDLEIQRRADEQIQMQAASVKQESDSVIAKLKKEHELKEESLKKKVDELNQKLEQGSMQTQGEVFELVLEDELTSLFPADTITAVAKGAFGADIVQTVNNRQGKACGVILWECKDTKNWSEKWVGKLKDDQRDLKADIAVIVSSALPKDVSGFAFYDGVWVTDEASFAGLCAALRIQITQIFAARQANLGKNEKMEQIYQYLSGHEFRQRVQGIVEAFTIMKVDLDKEKIGMEKHWAKREKELTRVITGTVGMYGDLEGIIGNALPRVEGLELAALPEVGGKAIELKKRRAN